MLCQLVTGDLSRPFGVGWEADVDDELLREDITACTQRDPAKRLHDAQDLANRLDRRDESQAEAREKAQQIDSERRALHQSRRIRGLKISLITSLLFLAGGIVAGYLINEHLDEILSLVERTLNLTSPQFNIA